MPLKILLVDDEPSIRDMVAVFLRGDADFVVAGEAFDGEAALDFLSRDSADIILTDLRMPVMDGLELIRRLRATADPPGIVVLSAYNEFPLVKEAFKLGVDDYLLKSEFTSAELRCVLEGLKLRRGGEAGKGGDASADLLRDLVAGIAEPSWEALSAMGYRLNRAEAFFQALVVEVFSPVKGGENADFDDGGSRGAASSRIAAFCERVSDLIPCRFGGYIRSTALRPAVVASLLAADGYGSLESMASSTFASIKEAAGEAGLEVAGGASELKAGAEFVPELFRHASAEKDRYYLGWRGRLHFFEEANQVPEFKASAEFRVKAEDLRKLVASKNGCQIKARAPSFMIPATGVSPASIKCLRYVFQSYHAILSDAAAEGNGECPELSRLLDDYEFSLSVWGTLEESNRWIRLALASLGEGLFSRSPVVRSALAYVFANYSGEAHLSHLARQLGVSEAHVGRQFSREIKCSFISYLSKFRMEKAAELLRTTNLKIYQIAERTGYPNTEHFSRTFKKVMGRSPKEFR